MNQKRNLHLPIFRLSSGVFRFLSYFCKDSDIIFVESQNQNEISASLNEFSIAKEEDELMILEYILKNLDAKFKKDFSIDLSSKAFIEVFDIYQEVKKIGFNGVECKIDDINKFLILNFDSKILLKNPVLSIILFESIFALNQLNENFLSNKNSIIDFYQKIQLDPLFQRYIFCPNNLLRPIAKYIPNNFKDLHQNISGKLALITDFACLNHALYNYPIENVLKKNWDHISLSPFPTLMIKNEQFEKVNQKSLVWNKLFDRMVKRISVFDQVFEDLSKIDNFVGNLWRISKKKKELKIKSDIEFCFFRNDYLKDEISDEWKQVIIFEKKINLCHLRWNSIQFVLVLHMLQTAFKNYMMFYSIKYSKNLKKEKNWFIL